MTSAGGELRMHITPYPEVAQKQQTPLTHATRSPPSFANATLADIQFPTFSAGPLGQDADWKSNDAGFGSPSRNAVGDSAIFRSTDAPTPLVSMQLQDLQSAVRRKDEMLQQFQEQVADMTRALNAQAIARNNWEEHEAEREGTLADAQAEVSRLAAALEAEQAELIQSKQLLKASAERSEANMRSARLEFEESAALLSTVQRDLAAAQSDLAAQTSATGRANTRAQEAEEQLALLEKHNAELAAQLKTNADDTAYVNKELKGLQAQCQLKEQERQQAVAALEAQRKTVAQLTAELEAQREDLAALPALLRDSAALADLRAEHSMLRDSHSATEAELTMHKNLLAMRDEECAKMAARLSAQEEAIRKLTASNTELADEKVDANALRTQLSQTQQDLDSSKASIKSLSSTNQNLRYSLDDLESRQIPLLKQRILELEGIETRMKLDLDQRSRYLKQHTEQMRTIAAKNPFNSRIDAAPKSNATGNAPTTVAIGIKESEAASGSSTPATGSAAATADADAFSQLREQLTAQLLDLNARTRLAYGLLLDSERALKHSQDELLDSKKQNILLQREAADNAAESSERLQLLEQQLMQSQQELLVTRSESQDSLAAASSNQAQMSMLWQSCQLLHRSYRPLLARFRDVCAQKDYLAGQVHHFQCGTARDVFELRKAMTSFENKNAAAAASSSASSAASNPALDSLAPSRPHPYRLHSGRLSMRVAVIAILAARRIWSPHGSEYGSMVSMGEQSLPVLQSNAFVLSSSLESKERDENPRAQARRDREMLLPSVDDSTADKAAASLVRLLEHFDSSSAYSAYSAAYPLLKRPNLSSRQSLLELLSNGQGFFQVARARNSAGRAPFATSSSLAVVPPPAASTRDDLARIRGVAWFLASSNKKLEQQLLALQAEYVLVIEQSGRTEEKLAQEQARAHEIMRDFVEKAREHENRHNDLIDGLRSSLAAAEADKQRMVSKEDYASLHHTSEMVLVKCRELERENHVLQDLHATLKARSDQDQQELSEREMVIRGLQRSVEQKALAITSLEKAQRNANEEMQQVWAQLRQAQQALLTSQQELVDARNEIQQLRIALGDLEHHRDDLASTVDELNQELLRVKEVIRGVTHAHRMAELQNPHTAAAAAGGASQALVSRPPPHPLSRSSAYNPSPLSSSVSFLPGSGGSDSSASGPPIEVRHHPNGNLSVDFGGAVLQHLAGSAAAADNSASSAGSGAMSSFAPPYPAINAPTPAASSSSSTSASHRGLFTPMTNNASRGSPRVKFSHDTK